VLDSISEEVVKEQLEEYIKMRSNKDIATLLQTFELGVRREFSIDEPAASQRSPIRVLFYTDPDTNTSIPVALRNLDVIAVLEEEKKRRIATGDIEGFQSLDTKTPLTRTTARAFVRSVKDKLFGRQLQEADTRSLLKLEGSRRAGRRLRKDLNAKLDKAIADGDTVEAERITGIINYIESFGFRGRDKNNFFSRGDDEGKEELRMEDPFHVFVSDMNSNWQVSSALPLMQLAQAELLGWDREEIIDRIFWAAPDEENRQEIREALEAMDNGKRISISLFGNSYDVQIEGDVLPIVPSDLDESKRQRELRKKDFVKKYVDEQVEKATEGRSDDTFGDDGYFDPMYEGGGFGDELEGFDDVPIPDDEEMAAVAPREAELEEQIKEWTKDAEKLFDDKEPIDKLEREWRLQEENYGNIERGLSRDGVEAAKLGLEMQRQEVLDELKKAGVTHITLYRGIGLEDGASTPEEILGSRTSPLSSWAFSPFVAESFATGREGNMILVEAAVPIEAIAGSSLTGFGAFHEDEVVVIAANIDPSGVVIHQGPDAITRLGDEARSQLADPEDDVSYFGKIGAVISDMDEEALIDSFVGKTIDELIYEGIYIGKERNDKKKIVDEIGTAVLEEDSEKMKEQMDAGEEVDINATFKASKRRLEKIIRELDPEGTYDPNELAEDSEFSSVSVDSPASSGSLPPAPPIATEQIVPTNPTEQQQLGDQKSIAVYKADPLPEIAEKLNVDKDWSEVTVNPEKTSAVSMAYTEAQEVTKEEMTEEARVAWTALATEVEEQYEMALAAVEEGGLGITIEFVDEDPYDNFAEMWEDYTTNKRVKVLKTEATGGHPFFTNEQNDKFRAVHDIFGHLATGRGFDRNGEEAAYQAHISMFGPDAVKAAATELRGQNSVLLETGDFPPQKLIILPEDMHKSLARWVIGILTKVLEPTRLSSEAQRQNDADNAYEITRSHHVSCGRYIA